MIWARIIWRDIRFNAVIWLFSLLGIAIGVGGWIGMEGATRRASQSFQRSMSTTFGQATHVIEDRSGNLPQSVYFKIATKTDLNLSPLIEQYGRIPLSEKNTKQYVRLLGIDPLSYGQFQTSIPRQDLPFEEFLAGENLVVLSSDFRNRYNEGDQLTFTVEDQTLETRVGGFIQNNSLNETVLFDIGWLQKELHFSGQISRILIRSDRNDLDHIKQWLDETSFLLPTGTRTRSVRSMIGAFQWNLRALSFLSLFVGAFLVYSTMYLYTSRQVNMISLLKTIGVSRGEVMIILFGGLLIIGLTGSLLGVIIGILLSIPMGELVGQTVDTLYIQLFAGANYVTWYHLFAGIGLGITMSLIGGFKPIYNNLGVSPRAWEQSEVDGGRPMWDRLILAGGGILLWIIALGVTVMFQHLIAGFFACFLIAFGGSLMSPLVLNLFSRIPSTNIWSTMALRNVRFYGSRTGVMVAVLVAAFSMVLAVSLMVNSFRVSVDQWINNVIKADYYVRSAPGSAQQKKPPFKKDFTERLRNIEEIKEVGLLAEKTILSKEGAPITLRGIEPDVLKDELNYQFNDKSENPWDALQSGGVWLSEPGSFRMNKTVGDKIEIPATSTETVLAPIAAVYNDYSTEWAVVYIDLDRMRNLFEDVKVTSAAIFTDGMKIDQPLGPLVNEYGYYLESQRTLKQRALKEFDRTFAVTDVMKVVSATVAGVGLLILLISFTQARSAIFGRLSALGSSRGQLIGMIFGESLLISFSAFLVSIPTGLYLSRVLIKVINRRSFGWLIPFSMDLGPFYNLVLLMGLALLVAISFPVYRLWTIPIDKLLREESKSK